MGYSKKRTVLIFKDYSFQNISTMAKGKNLKESKVDLKARKRDKIEQKLEAKQQRKRR